MQDNQISIEKQPTWLENESDWYSPKRELVRLKRRAQARWLVITLISALAVTVAILKLSRPSKSYTARVILRVTEGELLRDRSPVVGRALADYLLDATLRTDELTALLIRNNLFDPTSGKSEVAAANEFRDDLRIDVYRNYFAIDRGYAEGARTARISIRYTDSDPQRAMRVVREVADLMEQTEATNRRQAGYKLAEIARRAATAAETRTQLLQQEKAEAEGALSEAKENAPVAATLRIQIEGLTAAIERQNLRTQSVRRQLTSIELREAVVESQLGLNFRIVDEKPPQTHRSLRPAFLGMLAITLFVLLLPVVAIGVGAFDNKIHDADDIRRLGLSLLGQIETKAQKTSAKPAMLKSPLY